MTQPLDKVRWKVERGDRLEPEELELLSRAAREAGGVQLRLAVAHALLNNEAPGEALRVVEALAKEFPNDAGVHLAQARALVALDRWSEVEAPVQRALRANPKDPEAMKVLAVLAMRRGEVARAQALVNDVLRQDPFDSEAQLLAAELESGDAPMPAAKLPSRGEFVRSLAARLAARSIACLPQKDQLLLRVAGRGVARLEVDSLYRAFQESGRPLDTAVEALARELSERAIGLPAEREALLEKVLPVLRDVRFLERAEGVLHREGPAGLFLAWALEDPDLVRYVPEGVLQTHGVTLDEVEAAAAKNLAARLADLVPVRLENGALKVEQAPTGLWALAKGDGHDAARLLSAEQRARIEAAAGPGPWRVYLGLRELVLLCLELDPVHRDQLSQMTASPDGIEGVFRLDGGLLRPVSPWGAVS